jgi:hypothetical protein
MIRILIIEKAQSSSLAMKNVFGNLPWTERSSKDVCGVFSGLDPC